MSKHTSGPWTALGDGTIKSGDISIGEAYMYDENDYDYNPKSDDRRKKLPWMANACLMAEAPEMYDALRDLYNASVLQGIAFDMALQKAIIVYEELTAKIEGDE